MRTSKANEARRASQGRGRSWVLVSAFITACAGTDKGRSGDEDDSGEAIALPAGATVLDDVVVVDSRGARENSAVVIVGDEIAAVLDARQDWPDDALVLAMGGASVTPGLIDAHTHLFHAGSTWWVGDTLADNLAAQLHWGVVGVADLGSPIQIFDLRDRLADGSVLGPRIWATGPFLTAEGSHPCETWADDSLCHFVDGDGADQVAALSRADGIKVALADADFTPWPTTRLDLGDLADIVAAASAAGQPVFAHIDEPEDAADAVAAGVMVLAHPVFSEAEDDPPDAPVISTIGAFAGVGALMDGSLLADDLSATPDEVVAAWTWLAAHPSAWTEGWIEGSAAWEAASKASLAAAVAQGRTVIAGSDAGYWLVPHGLGLHRELAWLVEAGMDPIDALGAATSVPAELLGWTDLGFVDVGYRADLLIVQGRPDEDIAALRQIQAVYLGGVAVEGVGFVSDEADGDFCLDDRDCDGARCDLVDHLCREACAPTYDRVGSCDAETWCAPADGLDATTEGVCRPGAECSLYAQDCAPASYGANCVPVDIDTNSCWPSGARAAGQTCSWSDPAFYCAQGLFCSWIDSHCYALCDPDDADACTGCTRQFVEGKPWFGLCL